MAAGAAALGRVRVLVRGTTLVAAWTWAVAALGAVAAVELAARLALLPEASAWLAVLRYTAALATLAPAMSVLGAKRPQQRAWQFIVGSLLVVLVLPAAQAVVFRPGGTFTLPPAWALFLAALVLVGAANHLPTRFGAASALAAAGQACLLVNFQPWLPLPWAEAWPTIGLTLGAAAAVTAAGVVGRPRSSATQPLDRLWLDFRDLVGAAWGLRVAERFNQTARRQGWPVVLAWQGLAAVGQEKAAISPEVQQAARRNLVSLVGLFAGPEWIAQRLEET